MSLEQPPAIEPIDEDVDVSPADSEVSEALEGLEAREKKEIMDEACEKRTTLLRKVFHHKITEAALVLIPGTDALALAAFAARGETFTGKPLDPHERFNHMAIAGFLALSYVCFYSGMNREALSAKEMAMGMGSIQFGPELFEKTKKVAAEKFPGIAGFVEETANYLRDKESDFNEVQEMITLNLNG